MPMLISDNTKDEIIAYLDEVKKRPPTSLFCHDPNCEVFEDICFCLELATDGEQAYRLISRFLGLDPTWLAIHYDIYYREDLYEELLVLGLPKEEALTVTDTVRKGKARAKRPTTSIPLPRRLAEIMAIAWYLPSRARLRLIFDGE